MSRTDIASRIIRATPRAIYDAFVNPEAQAVWLPPTGMTGQFDLFEPRPGGRYRLTLHYADPVANPGKTGKGSDVVEGRFVELVAGERIVQTADFDSPDPAVAGTMTITWLFRAVSGGTEVILAASDVPPGISAEDHRVGLTSSLANLAAFVE